MSRLPKPIRRELKQVGWSKALELVKVARRDQQRFDSATWLHKAPLPKQEFKAEVERELTGRDTELCADFLAGAQIENGNPKILLLSILRLFRFLPTAQKQEFLQQVTEAV